MAGETILIADADLAAAEFLAESLENAGYAAIPVANGAAALTYPEMDAVDLLILDISLMDDGINTAKLFRTDEQTFRIPVLLLLSRDQLQANTNPQLYGAAGYLCKPFDENQFASKVQLILEERALRKEVDRHLSQCAEQLMEELAETHMRVALDKKADILADRMVQQITSKAIRKAQTELDEQVAAITAEKEDELVKKTVREVAQAMVEKLAEKRVGEAINETLESTTARFVRHSADGLLPDMIRNRAKEVLEYMLPKEISRRVQAEADSRLGEISKHLIETIDNVAHQRIQRIVNEQFPQLAEKHLAGACESQLPTLAKNWVERELSMQMPVQILPAVNDTVAPVKKKLTLFFAIMAILNLLILSGLATFIAISLQKAAQ